MDDINPSTTRLSAASNDSTGHLQINVTSSLGLQPIKDATVKLSYTGDSDNAIDTLSTNESGQCSYFKIKTPPRSYSLSPGDNMPYSNVTLEIEAPGYQEMIISGIEVFPDVLTIQPVSLQPVEISNDNFPSSIVIPPHTLYGDYPPKIEEAELKPLPGYLPVEAAPRNVVIPEVITVHDGPPADHTAKNYYVTYKDYIKNVASSEVYATWPESTLYANILAILSFTLNRVFTQWYHNKGYDFTITSSTAYDQKWVPGRNIYGNIDYLVESIFANYLARPNITQPIFTTCCDGKHVLCQGLSKWGSKYLGDEGYSAIEILRYYFGNSLFIGTADAISGIPSSWPGYNLKEGSSGLKVTQLQQYLNRISQNYSAIPSLTVDGIFGSKTKGSVEKFQRIFNLPVTGIVDYPTWYKISSVYVAVSRMNETAYAK